MACAEVHQGGCDGEGLAVGFASARAKREWEKAMVERGEARRVKAQVNPVGSAVLGRD